MQRPRHLEGRRWNYTPTPIFDITVMRHFPFIMSRALLLFLPLWILPCAIARGQEASPIRSSKIEAALREDPTRACVNTHSYEFLPLYDTPAPKGYKPVYISHYGRHGSRSDWGRPAYKTVIDALSKGKEAHILTPSGDSLLQEATLVYEGHDGMDGRLTQRGVNEHMLIAQRMYTRYRRVFTKGSGKVRSVSSTVPRCLVSMTAFTDALTKMEPNLDITWDTGENFMAYINNGCPDSLSKAADALIRSKIPAPGKGEGERFLGKVFTDPVKGEELVGNKDAFVGLVLHTARNSNAFDINPTPFRFLSLDAIYSYYENNAMNLYLHQCNSAEFGKVRTALCRPLVEDIVNKANDALGNGRVCADLRFGHDYPILSLFAFIGLQGAGDCLTLDEARTEWFATEYVPFASNLQMIFYRKGNDPSKVLVKFLVNEKETLVPALKAVSGPYYDWNEVVAYLDGRFR